MPLYLDQRPSVPEGAIDMVAIDCSEWLDSGELLTGTPLVTEPTGDLTLTNKSINDATLSILDNTAVIAGQAVQFTVAGQEAGTTYDITVTASTDAGRTYPFHIYLDCI